jgi:hypothetical protein
VKSRRGNGIVTEVGPDLYELPTVPSSINPPQVTFDWIAHGDGDDVTSSGCTVVADITGPGGYNETRRSGDCSGSPNSTLDIMVPGTYTISVAVTSPDGGAPVTATKTFEIIPMGG